MHHVHGSLLPLINCDSILVFLLIVIIYRRLFNIPLFRAWSEAMVFSYFYNVL